MKLSNFLLRLRFSINWILPLMAVTVLLGCRTAETQSDHLSGLRSLKDPKLRQLNRELIDRLEDRSIVKGKTENGTSYYIKNHSNSEGKIKVALIIDAGSVLERNNQLGLAHFVEHMGFNGTEKYPGNKVIDVLQKEGVRFGADLNASTRYDSTLFYITIPEAKPDLLSVALDITEEWLRNMIYGEEEIEKEKGVVLEEVRRGEQPYPKAIHQMWDYLNEGTPYYNRSPGGKLDVIATAPREVIKSFYDTWYKPNLAAVAVVGNVDVKIVEREILSRFQYFASPQEHPEYDFPLDPPDSFHVRMIPINDPEATSLGVIAFRERAPKDKRDYLWEDIVSVLFQSAFNYRLEQVVRESSFLKSVVLTKNLRGKTGVFRGIYFEPRSESFLEGYRELIREIERLRRWGVSDDEFKQVLTQYINYLKSSPYVNDSWLGQIYENFIYREMITSEQATLTLLENILDKKYVTYHDLNDRFRSLGLDTGIRFAALYASNQSGIMPAEHIFRDYYKDSSLLKLEALQSTVAIQNLLPPNVVAQIPQGEISSKLDSWGGYLFNLGNGVNVYYYPLVTSEKKVFFMGRGHNPNPLKYTKNKKDLFNFTHADQAFYWAELGGYHYREWQTFFDAQSMKFNFSMQTATKVMTMEVPLDSLEIGFQALYLSFTDLNYNSDTAEHFSNRVIDGINQMRENDYAHYDMNYQKMVYPQNPFHLNWDDYRMEYFDSKMAYDIMKESLDNIGDFTFYITGNVKVEELSYLLKKYLAALPVRLPTPKTNIPSGLTPHLENTTSYQRGREQSIVGYGWIKPQTSVSLKDRVMSSLVGEVLSQELFREIREKESGVYSINSYMYVKLNPQFDTELRISFSTKPERSRELIDKSHHIVERLSRGDISSEVIATARETLSTSYREFKNDLASYASVMYRLKEYGEDPLQGHLAYLETLNKVEDGEIYTYLNDYLKGARYFQVIQDPLDVSNQ